MNQETARRILESILPPEGRASFVPRLNKQRFVAKEIAEGSLRPIANAKGTNHFLFVDGGNAEIFSSPSSSLQYIRVYATLYNGNSRVWGRGAESFFSVKVSVREGKLCFVSGFHEGEVGSANQARHTINRQLGLDATVLNFDYDEASLREDGMPSAAKVADAARRFAELEFGRSMIEHLPKGTIMVIDGSLEPHYPNEDAVLAKLHRHAGSNGILVCGLAKTSKMLTEDGSSVPEMFLSFPKHDAWYAEIATPTDLESNNPSIFFAKLHAKSRHAFRIDIPISNVPKQDEIITALASNASDPSFPGYPYGMIDADRFARVSNAEASYLRTVFMARSGRNWQKLTRSASPVNAHRVLDQM